MLDLAGAFRVEAPTGTDYVLSKQLSAAGYKMRFVRHEPRANRISGDLTSLLAADITLVPHASHPGPPLGRPSPGADRAAGRDFLLGDAGLALLAPFSKTLRTAWLVALSHLLLNQVRVAETARGYMPRYPYSPWRTLASLVFLPVGWIGMANGFLQSILPKYKLRW